jgi:hypothetical protein
MREEQHGKREKWINLAFGVLLMLLMREEHKVESSLLSRRPPNHFLFSLVHDWKSEVVTKAARACSHDTHTHTDRKSLCSLLLFMNVYHCAAGALVGKMNVHFYRADCKWRNRRCKMWTREESFRIYIVAEACEHFVIASISEKNTYIIALHNF